MFDFTGTNVHDQKIFWILQVFHDFYGKYSWVFYFANKEVNVISWIQNFQSLVKFVTFVKLYTVESNTIKLDSVRLLKWELYFVNILKYILSAESLQAKCFEPTLLNLS